MHKKNLEGVYEFKKNKQKFGLHGDGGSNHLSKLHFELVWIQRSDKVVQSSYFTNISASLEITSYFTVEGIKFKPMFKQEEDAK